MSEWRKNTRKIDNVDKLRVELKSLYANLNVDSYQIIDRLLLYLNERELTQEIEVLKSKLDGPAW